MAPSEGSPFAGAFEGASSAADETPGRPGACWGDSTPGRGEPPRKAKIVGWDPRRRRCHLCRRWMHLLPLQAAEASWVEADKVGIAGASAVAFEEASCLTGVGMRK